jgi:hypothetical protein
VFVLTEAAGFSDDQFDSGSKVEKTIKMRTEFFCRVCACTSEELVPVFGEQGLELQLLEKIHIHLPIMVMACTHFTLLFLWYTCFGLSVTCGYKTIDKVGTTKFLGLLIDCNLKWKTPGKYYP